MNLWCFVIPRRSSRYRLNSAKETPILIIIVVRNSGSVLPACIDSVRRHTRGYEIVVVDNASTENVEAKISPGPDIRWVQLGSNVGFAKANNVAINMSTNRYVVLLNPDTIVTPRWLDVLVDEAGSSKRVGIVRPKLLRPNKPPIIDSTGHVYQYQTGLD